MRTRKPKTVSVSTDASHGFKEKLRIGRAIADQLTPVRSVSDVAKELGISPWAVRKAECLALYKLCMAVRAIAAKEGLQLPKL